MTTCPLCHSDDLLPFLEQKGVPAHQNMIYPSADQARSAPKGDLDMCACRNCGFVFNAAFDEAKVSYNQDYDNTQCHSGHFNDYLNRLVDDLVNDHDLKNATIVEVGCGKGDFIKKLIDYPGTDNTGYGFDPTYIGEEEVRGGRIKFEKKFYDENSASITADAVISRHVIEHVAKPLDLLRAVAKGLQNSPGAKVFFETPDVTWIFKNRVIWDFFYEHCSLFTPASITYAFEASGFAVTDVKTIFGDQYLWAESTPDKSAADGGGPSPTVAGAFFDEVTAYKDHYQNKVEALRALITKLNDHGPLALWGAGAKGVTLCNIIDPEAKLIDCVVDINPAKQGGFIAGTGHAIIGPDDLGPRNIAAALIMNPNYAKEIEALLHEKSLHIKLVNWND